MSKSLTIKIHLKLSRNLMLFKMTAEEVDLSLRFRGKRSPVTSQRVGKVEAAKKSLLETTTVTMNTMRIN